MPPAPRRGSGGGERRDRRDDRRGGGADKGTAYLERVVAINRVANDNTVAFIIKIHRI